jgi:hypothetical protein
MSLKVTNESRPVSSGYIGALYSLIGFTMLFDSIGRVLLDPRGIIAMLVITFLTSLSGLIMSSLAQARGTRNKSKITAVFSCIMSAMIFQAAGIVLANKAITYYGYVNTGLAIASLACQAVRLILVLTTGIIIITMTTRRDNPECPRLSMPAKLLVGIPSIISPLCTTGFLILIGHVSRGASELLGTLLVFYYIQIACTVLVGLGTILGIVLGLIHHQRRRPQPQDNDAFQSVVVA